ncbi:hypothetical protein PENTCL1PPCAC_29777, partial [Pristionchus entomophagus]
MLLLFLFSPVSFDAGSDLADTLDMTNETGDYDYYLEEYSSGPLIEYPAATDKRRKYLEDVRHLYAGLMGEYEKNLSPAYSGTSNPLGFIIPPVVVNVTVSQIAILGLSWTDERLSWDPSKYS